MADIPVLTLELLQSLEGRLRDLGSVLPSLARPGLSDDEMKALVEPHGIKLTSEARCWWRWRDGTPTDTADGVPTRTSASPNEP